MHRDSQKEPTDTLESLKPNSNISIAHLNINSYRYKFTELKNIIKNYFDVILIAETKLDYLFSTEQFRINGYKKPYRRDRSEDRFDNGGGLLVYVNENISSKPINIVTLPNDIELIALEISTKNTKWILLAIYRPSNTQDKVYFLNNLKTVIDKLSSKYSNFIIIGDVNMENEAPLNNFVETFDLVNLITEPTCFKSPENPSSIDVILTNKKKNFLKSGTYETGVSDHRKLIFIVMRSKLDHTVPKVVTYRDYKSIDNEKFSKDIHECVNNAPNCSSFHREFQFYLERHAPLKKMILRANHKDFIDKTIRKEILYRSQFKNKFNRNPTHQNKLNYRKQHNK